MSSSVASGTTRVQQSSRGTSRRPRSTDQCVDLRNFIMKTAVQRIGLEMLKLCKATTPHDLVEASHRVDVPYGLFGLKLENFFIRCKTSDVYLEALKLSCITTLNKTKMCIVLDDVFDYLARLLRGFPTGEMGPVIKDIQNSEKLLGIEESLFSEYKANSEALGKLISKQTMHNTRERNAIMAMNSEIAKVLEKRTESQLVVDPIRSRCILRYQKAKLDQVTIDTHGCQERLNEQLQEVWWNYNREIHVSNSVQMRLIAEIKMLKVRNDETREMYQRDSDFYDSQIGYKKNSMIAMQSQLQECLMKLDFFAVDKYRLIEWLENWELEKRAKAKRIMRESGEEKKKKGKK